MAEKNRTTLKADTAAGKDIVESQFTDMIDSALNITDDIPTVITGAVLTGLSLADSTDVDATDTILQAFGKAQAQLNAAGAPATDTGTVIDLSNVQGTWYGVPSTPVTDLSFTLGTIALGGWAGVYQSGASATFTGVTDDQSQHNTTVINLYLLWSPDGTEVSMINAYASPPNKVPIAFNLALSGVEESGNVLTLTYSYADDDADAEGTSTFKWYRADDALGTNEAAIAGETATTYTLQAADETKFIRASVIPVAQTGNTPGAETFSDYTGAIAAGSGFYPTDIQVAATGLYFLNMTDTVSSTIVIDSVTYSPEDAIASMVDEFSTITFDRTATTQRPRYAASAGTGTHDAYWYNVAIGQELITAAPTSLNFGSGDNFTVCVGVLFEDQLNEDPILFKGSTSTDERYLMSKHSDDALRIWVENTVVVNEAGFFTGLAGENMVITHTFDGATHKVFLNGVDQSVTSLLTTPTTTDNARWWVGSKGGAPSMKGEIGFAVIYRSELSSGDRGDLETWGQDLLSVP